MSTDLASRFAAALDARAELLDAHDSSAFRLFNGFSEGFPDLVVDVYGATVVAHDHAAPDSDAHVGEAIELLRERLPWVRAIVVKKRKAADAEAKRGRVVYGQPEDLDRRVREHGVWYAIDPLLNRDASFYLDTRNLRAWALENLEGKSVLNTFAYTGSLGVAAAAARAREVVHVDLNRQFLNVAKTSYTLNGLAIRKQDFVTGDFFTTMGALKRQDALFDCVFVDPPFFSTTSKGRVDLVSESQRAINKVRPLVGDGGWLVAINNALFVSGAEYAGVLEAICADGYLSIETFVPVPEDVAGYEATRVGNPPTDPAPFNHATKIAILRVRRKDGRAAGGATSEAAVLIGPEEAEQVEGERSPSE
jgi:23S rRNA (cytosine1962-C5)-methyltransferase